MTATTSDRLPIADPPPQTATPTDRGVAAPVRSASLESERSEPLETSSHPLALPSDQPLPYQRRIFGPRNHERLRVIGALRTAADAYACANDYDPHEPYTPIADKLKNCCTTPHAYYANETDTWQIHEYRCRSRLCPRCGQIRANLLRKKLRKAARLIDDGKFITLTLKSTDQPLAEQVRRLKDAATKLRRRKWWRDRVQGGIICLEVTHNPVRDQWHPHLHIVADASFLPHADLKHLWHEITTDSHIVDVRKAYSQSAIVQYLTEYCTKTQDASRVPDHRIPEWATHTHASRFISTFGTLFAADLDDDEPEKQPEGQHACGLNELTAAAEAGDTEARTILEHVTNPANHQLPDGDEELVAVHRSRNREILGRLRTWQLRKQGASNRDGPGKPEDQTPDDHPRLWPERDWQVNPAQRVVY